MLACLDWGANRDLHTVQLMPLQPVISCWIARDVMAKRLLNGVWLTVLADVYRHQNCLWVGNLQNFFTLFMIRTGLKVGRVVPGQRPSTLILLVCAGCFLYSFSLSCSSQSHKILPKMHKTHHFKTKNEKPRPFPMGSGTPPLHITPTCIDHEVKRSRLCMSLCLLRFLVCI